MKTVIRWFADLFRPVSIERIADRMHRNAEVQALQLRMEAMEASALAQLYEDQKAELEQWVEERQARLDELDRKALGEEPWTPPPPPRPRPETTAFWDEVEGRRARPPAPVVHGYSEQADGTRTDLPETPR